jgi:dTDP-4-amino-4,6-dideoxygalactose transaminase
MTWPSYSPACRSAVNDLLKAGGSLSAYRANPNFPSWTGPAKGSWADRLERDIERRFGVKHCIMVNSGTAALHAALASLRLKPGSEVVTTPFSFSATTAAILLAGGVPVFADVDPYTFNITKETVKHALTKKTKAILPVSLFGGLSDVAGLREYGFPVIADDCQAVGARGGYRRWAHVEAAAFSFNGGKQVPAGECGALVTDSSRVAERARYLANHGENFGKDIGYNYRPNEVTCAIAWHGLQELEERNQRRRDLVKELMVECAGDIFSPYSELPWSRMECGPFFDARYSTDGSHVFYVVPMLLSKAIGEKVTADDREKFCKRMDKMGVPVGRGYIQPTLNRYPAFRKYQRTPLPVVEELSSKTLCILSTLTPDRPLSYAKHVAECMRKALR